MMDQFFQGTEAKGTWKLSVWQSAEEKKETGQVHHRIDTGYAKEGLGVCR